MDLEFILLEENQTFGKNQLEILKKYGTKCAITDYAILKGGYVANGIFVNDEESLKMRTGYWWTKTPYEGYALAVDYDGNRNRSLITVSYGGFRPALPYSAIKSFVSNVVRGPKNVLIGEFAWYPGEIAPQNIREELELLYQQGELKEQECESYKWVLYKEKRYARVKSEEQANNEKLSDGTTVIPSNYYWVEVEPNKILIDEEKDIALFEKIVFSGIPFKSEGKYKGDFANTDIGIYLKEVFARDIEMSLQQTISVLNTEEKGLRKTKLQQLNPDQTEESKRRKMTATERIQNWIEAGQSVLLRGPSGIGKTDRIKTLYPDLIYIKLTNNMFPEKVVGSMNLQTGESIPPDFLKQAYLKCASEEEKKLINQNVQNIYSLIDPIYERSKSNKEKIVILLDELLNVKKQVQVLVYTLVLNRLVEINGGLKLPENVVIAATGNQKKYSSASEDIAEPLEKRFDHIYDMEPNVSEWLYEYAVPNKVHPSVIGFIMAKYLGAGKSEKIEDMGYFYEEPEVGEAHPDKYGCNGRTNDPRGWVSISNTLYAFENDLKSGKFIGKNVEDILRVSLSTKLRDEWTRGFYNFYNIPVLSVKDVVEKTFTQADLPRTSNEQYACVASLLLANKKEVGACRKFIKEYCDPDYLALYDLSWIGEDLTRMEKIMELKALENEDISLNEEARKR